MKAANLNQQIYLTIHTVSVKYGEKAKRLMFYLSLCFLFREKNLRLM